MQFTRPIFHFVAPRGWMNDPCAPGYDPQTGYHLMYQWNPHSHLWGNISWGAATSQDLVQWEYTDDKPVLVPSEPYDHKGIFTGCMVPASGTTPLAVFYTSVAHLPIHWTKENKRGAEGVALATSRDGRTWEKSSLNPVVVEEPEGMIVTGFRDPYVAQHQGRMYAVLSGGIQEGPRLFLYELESLTEWTFLRTLGDGVPRNLSHGRWGADTGANWECAQFMPLAAAGEERMVWIIGLEGGANRAHVDDYNAKNPGRPRRDAGRYLNWYFSPAGSLDLEIGTTGCVDWGDLYALSTFVAADGRRLAWGWLVEQDLAPALVEQKGWCGGLGVLRQLSLKVYDGVVETLGTPLEAIGSIDARDGKVVTLGIEPPREVAALRGEKIPFDGTLIEAPAAFDLEVRARISQSTQSVTVTLRDDGVHSTRVVFLPAKEQLWIHRDLSTDSPDINTSPELAPHTLFVTDKLEDLYLRILLDGDVLEVFANGRTALATRVYAGGQGVSVSCEGDGEVSCEMWEMGSMGLV